LNPKVTQITGTTQSKIVIEDPKVGKLECVIRTLPAYTLLENIDKFNKLKGIKDFDTNNLTDAQAAAVRDEILPVMKIVLPNCVIDPPIAVEDTDPRLSAGDAVNVKDLSFKLVIDLFNEIMKLSGLDAATDEARKKLESQTLPKA